MSRTGAPLEPAARPSPAAANSNANATEAEIAPAHIAATLLALLDARRDGATICPSEVARALAPASALWRALMPAVRGVAADLAAHGRVRVTQQGRPVDALTARGAIRIGRPPPA